MPNLIKIKKVENDEELKMSLQIRQIVFCDEQKVPRQAEFDNLDHVAKHFLSFKNNIPVGTARLRKKEPGVYKIERVAVLKNERLNGIGKLLMEELITECKKLSDLNILFLHSQIQVNPFYESIGFKAVGGEFVEEGILHVKMVLDLKRDTRFSIPKN